MDDEVQKILRTAGIESCPVDPSSMEALAQLVKERRESDGVSTATATATAKEIATRNAPSSASASASASASSMASSACSSGSASASACASASLLAPSKATNIVSFSGLRDDASEHNEILRLLHMQTTMMIETQTKLDAMAAKVDLLERKLLMHEVDVGEDDDAIALATLRPIRSTTTSRTWIHRQRDPFQQTGNRSEDEALQQANGAGAVTGTDPGPSPDPESRILRLFQSIFNMLSKLTIIRIIRLFWERSKGHVRALDGGLMFKLLFMIVVMTARMSRSPASSSSSRVYFCIFLMVTGILYHTQYLQFFYQFFWKDKIPMRVWAGEDVEHEGAAADHQNNRNDDNDDNNDQRANAQRPGIRPMLVQWRHDNDRNDNNAQNNRQLEDQRQNVIAGAIQPRDQNQNFAIATLQDIFYLFASFLFSIFPMWQPAALRRPNDAESSEEDNDGRHQQQQQQHQQQQILVDHAPQIDVAQVEITPSDDDDENRSDDDSEENDD